MLHACVQTDARRRWNLNRTCLDRFCFFVVDCPLQVGPGQVGIVRGHGGATDYVTYHYYSAGQDGLPTLGMRALMFDAQGWPMAGPVLF